MAISRTLTSSSACMYLPLASADSCAYFSRSRSRVVMVRACIWDSALKPSISASRFRLLFSAMRSRSTCFCVLFSTCNAVPGQRESKQAAGG